MTANTVELQTEVAVKTQEYQQPEYEKLVDEFSLPTTSTSFWKSTS